MMKGDFLKISKEFDDEIVDPSQIPEEQANFAGMDTPSLQAFIMNELSRANESKIEDVFGAIKLQMRLPPEMEKSFTASYQKAQYIIKHLGSLSQEQLANIAKTLTSA